MKMVKVDFTGYTNLAACPKWWRDFVMSVPVNDIDIMLEQAGCMIIDHPTEEGDLVCLVFESQEAYDSFRTYWTLKGRRNAG